MLVIQIVAATLLAGVGSVWLAAALGFLTLSRFATHLLSLAAGALLATALLNLLPEAFETGDVEPHMLFALLLGAMVFFFLLDKAELYHHGHEHGQHTPTHGHEDAFDKTRLQHTHAVHSATYVPGSWPVLLGDSVHAWMDGILIAAAFAASPHLGWSAALAVLAHEIPHHIGDLIALSQGDRSAVLVSRTAFIKVSLSGVMSVLGGVAGYFLLRTVHEMLAVLLVVAASSFIYVALADLIPQLQRRMNARETLLQVSWLLAGIGIVELVTQTLQAGGLVHQH